MVKYLEKFMGLSGSGCGRWVLCLFVGYWFESNKYIGGYVGGV